MTILDNISYGLKLRKFPRAEVADKVSQEMAWDLERVNVHGGAIALGHPVGASGTSILVTLMHEMVRRDVNMGLTSLCIGGGQGIAMIVERAR